MNESTLQNISVILFLLSSLSICFCENKLNKFGVTTVNDTQQDSLSRCIETIARKTFYRTTLTMIYEEGSFNKSRYIIHRSLFSIGIAIQHVLTTNLMDNQEHLCSIAYFGGNFLLAIRNHTLVQAIFRKFRQCSSWSSERKVIALVPLYGDEDRKKRIPMIRTVLNLQLVNSIAMIENDYIEDRYDIVSGYAYSRGVCVSSNHSDLVMLDSCLNGILDRGNVELFPKAAQLNACPIRIGTVIYEPFITARSVVVGNTTTQVVSSGLEVRLMNEMARILNFSVVYVVDSMHHNWGDVYPNGTLTGLFKMLKEHRVELVMSSLSASVYRNQRFHGLYPILFDSHTYCVPYADSLPAWLKLINVMRYGVFIVIASLMVIMVFLVHTFFNMSLEANKYHKVNIKHENFNAIHPNDIRYYNDPCLTWLLLAAMMLTNSVRRYPRNWRVRGLLTLWFLLSINIDTGFRTHFMASLSKDDHKPQLSSLEEIIQKNYTVFLPEHQFTYYKETEHPGLMQLWSRCNNLSWCLDQVAYGRNAALGVSSIFAATKLHLYVPPGHGHPIIHCLPNITLTFPSQMFSTRGFSLAQSFNEVIQRLNSAGFVELWKRKSFPVLWITPRYERPDEEIQLRFEHLQAVFVLIGISYAIACGLLIAEISYYKLKK